MERHNMINNDYENYGKPFHYLLSPSIWLDLDSFVYIVVVALIVFGVVKIVAKFKKSKKKVKIIDFFSRYMLACSIPVFLLFFIQLYISGEWILSNIIVSILPIIYGAIIQLIFVVIRKFCFRIKE